MSKILLLPIILAASSSLTFAETSQTSWPDISFAFCEGIGIGASGRVSAYADYSNVEGGMIIKSLMIATQGHNFDHSASGHIRYTDMSGNIRSVTLQRPWFDVLGVDSPGEYLYLPKNNDDLSSSSPSQQIEVNILAGSEIDISLVLLFKSDGGSCPTSFSENWRIP